MYVLTISHTVEDYNQWKAVYDTMQPTTVGGARVARVNRKLDDDKTVIVVAAFDTLDALNGFVADPRIDDASKRAGIIGEPRVEIYQEVEVI